MFMLILDKEGVHAKDSKGKLLWDENILNYLMTHEYLCRSATFFVKENRDLYMYQNDSTWDIVRIG